MNTNRGSVWWINLDPTVGSEIKKQIPCVIISHSSINTARKTVIVVPLSSSPKAYPPLAIKIKCQNKNVIAVCDQIRAVDKSRLINYIENINLQDMKNIEESIKQILVV